MSRKTIITRAQRKADGPKQKINASEVSRVSRIVLDDIEAQCVKLEHRYNYNWMNARWDALKKYLTRKRRTLKGGK